jgi:hypothetical protein
VLHAIGQHDLVGQREPPRLHGVRLAEVLLLDLGVGVVGDGVAFGSLDAALGDRVHDLLVERECLGVARLRVVIFVDDVEL